ncbi:hypothetical protein PEC18_39560 [Paucibacter sp. O1-1]|nr:hypothetical protein [Paucibacter sp. O1-1]MDA3831708.1 hypothetical protein [Paucibacter sp. O1-1]
MNEFVDEVKGGKVAAVIVDALIPNTITLAGAELGFGIAKSSVGSFLQRSCG